MRGAWACLLPVLPSLRLLILYYVGETNRMKPLLNPAARLQITTDRGRRDDQVARFHTGRGFHPMPFPMRMEERALRLESHPCLVRIKAPPNVELVTLCLPSCSLPLR